MSVVSLRPTPAEEQGVASEVRRVCVQAAFELLRGARDLQELAVSRRQQPPREVMAEMTALASDLLALDAKLPLAAAHAIEMLGRAERLERSLDLSLQASRRDESESR